MGIEYYRAHNESRLSATISGAANCHGEMGGGERPSLPWSAGRPVVVRGSHGQGGRPTTRSHALVQGR
jgi:hypothetical protein